MRSYRCAEIAQLAHELTLSPLRLRLRQLTGIARVLQLIDPKREYPYSFVCYHITGYRPRRPRMNDTALEGKDLTADLVELMDFLTADSPLPLSAARGPIYDAEDLAKRCNVSTRTISRWRSRGLAGCWYTIDGQRPRLAFSNKAVQSFVARNQALVRRGATFQFMSRDEKELVIARARELVASEKCSLHVVTVRLAEETGRAVETLRYTLRRFDQANPDEALFDRAERAIEIDENTVIFQAYVAGDQVKDLAARFDKREGQIRRILTSVRAGQLLAEPIAYIYNETFDAPDADRLVLHGRDHTAATRADDEVDVTLVSPPAQLPQYLRDLYRTPLLGKEEESRLFMQMNFLLHQAEVLRQQLPADAGKVKASAIAAIDDLLQRASEIKNHIIQANLRLVVSIARRHLPSAGPTSFFELISDGNVALIRAVEKFDYGRGFRFSTYGSWAIKRTFARSIPDEMTRLGRFRTGCDEVLSTAGDRREAAEESGPPAEEQTRHAITESLQALDDRERLIVIRHFGLADDEPPVSLEEIGREVGLSKERVRRIEIGALGKLRDTLGDRGVELLAG